MGVPRVRWWARAAFPRHWVYDKDGQLSHKSGLADFKDWYRKSFGRHTPWGDQESKALVTAVETRAGAQTLRAIDARRGEAKNQELKAGTTLVRQGESGSEVFLLLDGVLRVEHDGERLAEYGPGAMLGERAHLEGGVRTSTLVAVTACRVAAVEGSNWSVEHCTSCQRVTVGGTAPQRVRAGLSFRAGASLRSAGLHSRAGSRLPTLRRAHVVRGDRPRRRDTPPL